MDVGSLVLGGTSGLPLGDVDLLDDDLLAVKGGVLLLTAGHAGTADAGEEGAADIGVLGEGLLGVLDLEGAAGADGGGHEALDLSGLVAVLLAGLGDLTADHDLADILVAVEAEDLADGAGALGAKTTGGGGVGDALDGLLSVLHDDDVEDGDVVVEDATAEGLTAALSLGSAETLESDGTAVNEEGHAGGGHNSVDHGETLAIGASVDAEDVTLELIAEDGTVDLVTQTVVGHVDATENVVDDLELLAGAVAGVSDVKLHP